MFSQRNRIGALLFLSAAGLSAIAQDAPQNDPMAPTDPEIVKAATLAAENGGTGSYRAIMTVESSLHTHTIYRPADLSPFGESLQLPIVVWANGACANFGNRFRYFLTEVASHGYFMAAIGPVGPQYLEGNASMTPPGDTPPPPVDPEDRPQPTSWTLLIDAIDWAIEETQREGGPYYGKLDKNRIAVMGMSCGGLQAILAAADPRTTTAMIWNSGTFPANNDRVLSGAEATKASLADLHTPVAYISGDESDVAFRNSNDDFEQIDHVPVLRAYQHGVGHGDVFRTPNGGSFGKVGVAWLNWQLKGDLQGKAWFTGNDCVLCRDESWELRSKNLE